MDGQKTSISPHDLYARPGTATAPLVLDVRRVPAFEKAERLIASALRRAPDDVEAWRHAMPAGRQVVAYCVHGHEVSQGVAAALRSAGARVIGTTVTFAAVLACIACAGFSQTGAIMIAIGSMAVGAAPSDFEFARTGQGGPSQWSVVADTSSGGHVIEQTSADAADYRFPLAIYTLASARNVDVALRFKAMAGKVDQAGGIAVRLLDANNYYVVRANALEDNIRFYRVVNGRREQLDGVNIKVTANEWHQLGLRAEGEKFSVTFEGRPLFTTIDQRFAGAGRIALWTKSDSVTRFDQIEIRKLP